MLRVGMGGLGTAGDGWGRLGMAGDGWGRLGLTGDDRGPWGRAGSVRPGATRARSKATHGSFACSDRGWNGFAACVGCLERPSRGGWTSLRSGRRSNRVPGCFLFLATQTALRSFFWATQRAARRKLGTRDGDKHISNWKVWPIPGRSWGWLGMAGDGWGWLGTLGKAGDRWRLLSIC